MRGVLSGRLVRRAFRRQNRRMAILLIHTGGTIGMAQTEQGFAPREGVVESAVREMIAAGEVPDAIDIRTFSPLIDSANARPEHWNLITEAVAEAYDRYDGFVVTHGTDTLAYSAAACCYALQGLEKPVVLTGAMRPLTVEGGDSRANLREALVAAGTAERGVWVQFAGKLMHAARISKTHASRLDAFSARPATAPPRTDAPSFRRVEIPHRRVAVLTVTPGLPGDVFRYAAANLDGVVLRCYGSGTAPDEPAFVEALQMAAARGAPIVAVTKCPDGAIAISTYAAGAVLRDNGVVDGRDMTSESAYVKLMHVLDEGADLEEVKARLATPICGEISPAALAGD